MMRRRLPAVMLAPAPPKSLRLRWRTSTKTNTLPSRQIKSISPPRTRKLRSTRRRPQPSRWRAASASASRPRAVVVSLVFVCIPEKMTEESAALYVVPTPLGNMTDLTRRAEEILRTVPWVAAEDTRHSGPLLKQLGAKARTLPAHQHNEHEAAARIVERLLAGEAVALISDAGTPGISDSGARIVAAVRAAGCPVIPLPGPCAVTTALSGSGLLDEHFLFYGFLPSKAGQRRQAIEALREHPYALVFYEAPHRVLETVADLATVLGERTLVIARELTKMFESIHSCPLSEALDWLKEDSNRQRGEFVLMVSGAPADADDGEGERVLKLLLAEGLPVKQASKLASAITGAAKNALYERALALKS